MRQDAAMTSGPKMKQDAAMMVVGPKIKTLGLLNLKGRGKLFPFRNNLRPGNLIWYATTFGQSATGNILGRGENCPSTSIF